MSKKGLVHANALTIAGSDSGGGAGIQADLKTFAYLGVHGTSVITCVTAQNPQEILAVKPCTPKLVQKQIEAVLSALPPSAVKTGMLFSKEIIRTVAKSLSVLKGVPIIVDPVIRATSGGRLLQSSAMNALRKELLPIATLVTPNIDEVFSLIGLRIQSTDDMRSAAHCLHDRLGCAVLVKGGHLTGAEEAIDIFFDGRSEFVLKARFIRNVRTHGTGCIYSSAIAGYLALGQDLVSAVRSAKEHVTHAIGQNFTIKRPAIMNGFWKN